MLAGTHGMHLGGGWTTAGVIVTAFVAAWLISRASGIVAEFAVRRYERRQLGDEAAPADTGVLVRLNRRETMISLVRTSIRYLAYGFAIAISIGQLLGWTKSTAIAGASLLVVLIGFAGQRFLTDLVAGLLMFFEGWFSVGDTIVIEPLDLSGVVEEVSLRSTTLRAVTGETIRVNNSQIFGARILPSGAREVEIELFVTDSDEARRLVEDVELTRMLISATVAHGREWLVNDFLPDILKERAPEGLIAHGPVVMFVDDRATRRFARSVPASSRQPR
jgi:small-conductance mechanosensitive channel